MFHNNTSISEADGAEDYELSAIALSYESPILSSVPIETMQTPPRLRASSSRVTITGNTASSCTLPPQFSLTEHIVEATFEGDAEQNYQRFFDFLISGQSKVYNQLNRNLLRAEAKSDFEEEDLETTFKHKFNLNMKEPHYAGGQEENDAANQCANEFLNYFWHNADNLKLTVERHKLNKEQHADGLRAINNQIQKLIDVFRKDSPYKKNIALFYNLVKSSEPDWKKDLQSYCLNNETAWAAIQLVKADIPNNFNDLEDLTKKLEEIYRVSTEVFSLEPSRLEREETLLALQNIYELTNSLVKYLRRKHQRLQIVIAEASDNLNASCLSFVTAATVYGKKHCYLSISSPQHNDVLLTALRESVDSYNATEAAMQFGFVFHIITEPASQNSQLLLQKIISFTQSPHPADPFKHCAEKSYITMLAKLSYEKDIAINSICNVNFLPLTAADVNRMQNFPGTRVVPMQIQNQSISYCVIPACKNCKINKVGALIYIGAATEYRTHIRQQIREEHSSLVLTTSTQVGLFTPERRKKEKISFVSPLVGLYPGHNTPSPQRSKKHKDDEMKAKPTSLTPSLNRMGSR